MYNLKHISKNYKLIGNSKTKQQWDYNQNRYVIHYMNGNLPKKPINAYPIWGFACDKCHSAGNYYMIYEVDGTCMCQYCACRYLNIKEFGIKAWLDYRKNDPELNSHFAHHYYEDETNWSKIKRDIKYYAGHYWVKIKRFRYKTFVSKLIFDLSLIYVIIGIQSSN